MFVGFSLSVQKQSIIFEIIPNACVDKVDKYLDIFEINCVDLLMLTLQFKVKNVNIYKKSLEISK